MMEWEPVYRVAALGFAVGILFGAVANKTNFCTMGAVSDWVNMGSKDRLRAWFLAIGIAILATRLMDARGLIDIDQSIYRTPNFGWLGHIVGGFLFGVGMTLASGCGQRTLVRLGGGNLKSLVVILLLGISAYMTLRGLLALVRVNAIEVTNIDLGSSDISGQGIDTLLAAAAGTSGIEAVSWAVAIVLALAAIIYAFAGRPSAPASTISSPASSSAWSSLPAGTSRAWSARTISTRCDWSRTRLSRRPARASCIS
jgi:uncharacterized membrane protein YedE/YeeE